MFSKDVSECLSTGKRSSVSNSSTVADDNSTRALSALRERMESSLEVVVNLVSGSMKFHQRLTVNALLTIFVHWRDVVGVLINTRVTDVSEFQWSRCVQ